ncbi:hypothetical protein COS16_11090 [Candidatus Desantisbacteria bacterium CG02_land_8_20_14_3_00_49_13]|nr:MAG: hypothetical protein COS16_11090 [Candidatus Desantisbacteria bacterium CG02_land_8_20_14_3_00_49_13]
MYRKPSNVIRRTSYVFAAIAGIWMLATGACFSQETTAIKPETAVFQAGDTEQMRSETAAAFVQDTAQIKTALDTATVQATAVLETASVVDTHITMQEQKTTAAVMDLEAQEGVSAGVAKSLSDYLRVQLINTQKFDIVTRENVEDLLKEQKLQLSGCTSNECVVQVGQLLGVRKMFAGVVTKIGVTYVITLKIIDVESGKIGKAETEECAKCEEDTLLVSVRNIANKIAGLPAKEGVNIQSVVDTAAAQQQAVIAAVMDLEAKDVSLADTAFVLSDHLRSQIESAKKYKVLARGDMQEILRGKSFQLAGCISLECILEAGRLLNAKKMFAGSLEKTGETSVITLQLIDVQSGLVEKEETEQCTGTSGDSLRISARNIAYRISGLDYAQIVERAAGVTAAKETVPPVIPAYIPPLRAGLSLMPTAYVRMSPKHDWETGFNADFLFNFYIGEIFGYANKQPSFFTPYRIFMFGADVKYSFAKPILEEFTHFLLLLFGGEQSLPMPPLRPELQEQLGGSSLFIRRLPLEFDKKDWMPTIAFGTRGWLFKSMGESFDLMELSGAPWIMDFYAVGSKQVGDFGFHFGYLYGSFLNSFLKEIHYADRTNQGQLSKNWSIGSDSHALFVGFDMNVPWGTKKFAIEASFPLFTPDTFLINTSLGLWGFDLAFLKAPSGFSVIGYWSFRSNMLTFF